MDTTINMKGESIVYHVPRVPKNYSHFKGFNYKRLDHLTFYMEDNIKYPPITFLIIAL